MARRFDAMRRARGGSDRLEAQYRDCDGCLESVVGVIVPARCVRAACKRQRTDQPKRKLVRVRVRSNR